MVCIAAFIVLVLVGVAAALISIFNREFGKKYLELLKKSFHCFGKRVRLQKCDTNFSEDVKTMILKKVVVKKPKLVKPLSITIEIASAALIIATIWSLIEVTKAGLSLWVFGTCNVSQPSNCALGAESCSIDEDNLNWFTEWGEIFSNIPDRVRTWDANDYLSTSDSDSAARLTPAFSVGTGEKVAISIIDPGCSVCLQSYKNIQSDANFLKDHTVYVVAYPIKNPAGDYRFKNSELISRYLLSVDEEYAAKIMNRIFTEFNADSINFQSVFNNDLSTDAAATLLDSWLTEWDLSDSALSDLKSKVNSAEITEKLEKNRTIIDSEIKPKGIPTFIYDGKKHLGLYKSS